MTKKHSTKRTLIASILVICLCLTSFIGTTFAWFTDSVTSAGNIIKSGKLDVELYYADGKTDPAATSTAWTKVDGDPIYKAEQLWEPGYTDAKHIKIANVGTLALKYQLAIVPTGEVSELADVIDVYYVEGGKQVATRADLATLTPIGTLADLINNGIATGALDKGENYVATLVLKMQESADNDYQELSIGDDFDIRLLATQATAEEDSIDKYYDAGAPWLGEIDTEWYNADPAATEFTINTAEELAGLAEIVNSGTDNFHGNKIILASNLDLNDASWTPIGTSASKFDGTFDGAGHTIYNLSVNSSKYAGLFGCTWTSAHVEDLTIDGAYVTGNDYVGAVVGGGYMSQNCIKNCTVKNAEITATPYLLADGVTYDGGAKAGAIGGSIYNANLVDNKAINCTITAYRDLGGIAGMLYADGEMTLKATGNEVDNVTIEYYDLDGAPYADNKVNENMNSIVGRLQTNRTTVPVVENNIETNVKYGSLTAWIDNGVLYTKDEDTGVTTLKKVTADYVGTTFEVPAGVNALGVSAFNSNKTIETVILGKDVVDLGRGFDSNTTIKKVVLNEGLTTISSRAFKATTALEEVVISSTVKTIADDAFQKTCLKSITIPANVDYIGVQAFGASLIESVTIEGDVTINNKAFRGCAKLTEFTINGENIDFINVNSGTGDCWICKSESNNPKTTTITFNVKNPVVEAKVRAAMGLDIEFVTINCENKANQETGFWTDDNGKTCAYVTSDNAAALDTAIKGGVNTLYLGSGSYIIPDSAKNKTLTIVGSADTVVASQDDGATEGDCDYSFDGSTVTFENVTITTSTTYFPGYARMKGIYNNCTINGVYTLYDDSTFNNCTFNVSGDLYNIWTWGASVATFNNCTFNTSGKAILLYGNINTVLTVTDCVFNDANDYAEVNNKAAIEVGSDWSADTKTIIASNCTVNGFDVTSKGASTGTTLFGDKNDLFAKNRLTVTLDGATYVSNGLYKNGVDYYAYNAVGFEAMYNYIKSNGTAHAIWGATFNVMADIDASGMVWDSIFANTPNNDCEGFTFDGHGHTISGMKINGSMFHSTTNGKNTEVPTTFKNITFDGVTVVGGYHTGIVWGQMYGDIVLDNVHVKNSSITGTCNVGALIGRNGDGGASTVAYKNCSVTNTAIVALGNGDPNGASIFQGSALTIGADVTAKITFENCTQSGNTVTCADGQVGGGIYAWWNASTNETGAVNGFENYN